MLYDTCYSIKECIKDIMNNNVDDGLSKSIRHHLSTQNITRKQRHLVLLLVAFLILTFQLLSSPLTWKEVPSVQHLLSSKKFTYTTYIYNENERFLVVRKEQVKEDQFKDNNNDKFTKDVNKSIDPNTSIAEHGSPINFKTFMKDYNSKKENKDMPIDIQVIDGYNYENLDTFNDEYETKKKSSNFLEKIEMEAKFQQHSKNFFDEILKSMKICKPTIPAINNDVHYPNRHIGFGFQGINGRMPVYGGHLRENYAEEPIRTEDMLNSFLKLSNDEVEALKTSHKCFLNNQVLKSFPPEMFESSKYNRFMKGDGIVYLGGFRYYELILISLKSLRDFGSRLPVEVIIPSKFEYNPYFCNDVFPAMNAECKVMGNFISKEMMPNISGYQLKSTAMLVSSFERILYLDSDNIPLANVDDYFVNPPFTKYDMVVWPDIWRRSTSPKYYEIAEIPVNASRRVRNSYQQGDPKGKSEELFLYHDCDGTIPEASSETGQLLINKRTHFEALVLSMYYNYFGPDYFYPLLSQGAAGEGDKETFIAAAHKLKLPYYQVKEYNREFGPKTPNGGRDIFAMGQYDPILDYIQAINGTQRHNDKNDNNINSNHENNDKNSDNEVDIVDINNKYTPDTPYNKNPFVEGSTNNYGLHKYVSSKLSFLHANWPKLHGDTLFYTNARGRGPIGLLGIRRRLYNLDLLKEFPDLDAELKIMEILNWIHCSLNLALDLYVPTIQNKICEQLKEELEYLKTPESRNVHS